MIYCIHPEAYPDVLTEFKRLKTKNQNADGSALWKMAEDYVRTIAIANTHLLKDFMMEEV